jgi:hypothetical protein
MEVSVFDTRKKSAKYAADRPIGPDSLAAQFPVIVKLHRDNINEPWPGPVEVTFDTYGGVLSIAPKGTRRYPDSGLTLSFAMVNWMRQRFGKGGHIEAFELNSRGHEWRWAFKKQNERNVYFYFRDMQDAVFFRMAYSI